MWVRKMWLLLVYVLLVGGVGGLGGGGGGGGGGGCRILKLGPLRTEHDLREPLSVAKTASSARGRCVENE